MKHTAIYARVSGRSQDTVSQMPELNRWKDGNGGDCILYSDTFSGRTMDRPGWNRLMAAVQSGKVDRIVCWRLDRLGRTAKGLTSLFAELTERKVNLVSIKDGLDLSTAAGRLMANVLASVAQFETEVRAERVLAGQAVAKSRGVKWGGSVAGKRHTIKPEQIAVIKQMKYGGSKITSIARATGLSRPSIYSVIKSDCKMI